MIRLVWPQCAGIVSTGWFSLGPVSTIVKSIMMSENICLDSRSPLSIQNPAVLVLDRYKCVPRHGLSAVNTNQPDHARNSLTMFKAGKCPPSRQVFGGHSYFRRHGLHHAEDRARNDRNLRIVAGHSAEPNLVLSSAGIQLQQSPQFHDVRQDFRRNLFRAEGHEAHQLL